MDDNTHELLKYVVNQLNETSDLEIAIALLQKRMCELVPPGNCISCPWKGSILCLPIRRHLENVVKEI